MKRWNLLRTLMFVLSTLPTALWAQNPNCTIVIPDAPLTAAGLATPYQLKATDPSTGQPCEETNSNSSAFVQAAIIDPISGKVSIYNPLVVSQDSPTPAAPTVVPVLPAHAIVALWFGFNGNNLVQEGATPAVLKANHCVNGVVGSVFGQYSYCNAPQFFAAANRVIREGKLHVPRLGFARDGLPCPTVRDFYVVDQDQSDNLPVTYLISTGGQLAQNTQVNKSTLANSSVLGNPSDNGLLDRFLDPSIGCTPWKAPDLADPGQEVPSLALNELQARFHQKYPMARIPAGDPMVLKADGSQDFAKLNAYRRGVDQFVVRDIRQAGTARYCRNMLRIAPSRLAQDKDLLQGPSPVPDNANTLFTFLAQRFVASYGILGCADLVPIPDPVSVTTDVNGVAVDASINLPDRCRRYLKSYEREDNDADSQDSREAIGVE